MQQRLTALQAAQPPAPKQKMQQAATTSDMTHHSLPHIQPCSSTAQLQDGALPTSPQSQGRASPQLAPSHGRASPKSLQTFTEREPVADSPITLFSLGNPYSSSSPWCCAATGPSATDTTANPSEWAKLMAVKSMVGSALVNKASRMSPLTHEGSGVVTKGPSKGILSRASSGVPLPLGTEAASRPGVAAPAGAKLGRRAVFSTKATNTAHAAAPESSGERRHGKTPDSTAAMQSSDVEPSQPTVGERPSNAAELGSAGQIVTALRPDAQVEPDQDAGPDTLSTQHQSASDAATDAADSGAEEPNADDPEPSYVYRRSTSGPKPQRVVVPAASPLSRVVTYRPEMLRAAASAYQAADTTLGLSQSRLQDSMWEESPVAATLRYNGMTIEQREKQAEFAAQLGQWYKEQLQRRVPSRTAGLRSLAE